MLAKMMLLFGVCATPMVALRSRLRHRSTTLPDDYNPDDALTPATTPGVDAPDVIVAETFSGDHGNVRNDGREIPRSRHGERGAVKVTRQIEEIENGTHGHFMFEEHLCDSEVFEHQELCNNFKFNETVLHALGRFNFSEPITADDVLTVVAFTGSEFRPESQVDCAACGEDCPLIFPGDENESYGWIHLPDCPVPANEEVDYMFINMTMGENAAYMVGHRGLLVTRVMRLGDFNRKVFQAHFDVHMDMSANDAKKEREYLDEANANASTTLAGITIVEPTDEMQNNE